LILLCSASLVLHFYLVSFPSFLAFPLFYELFINMYAMFVIHLIIS
jgi:hypothetical protein